MSGDTEKFDPDKNVWVDEVTGQPMDKTAKTNIRIFDVPVDAMNQRVSVPKAVINKISGGVLFQGQTNGDVMLPLGQALGLGTTYRAQEGQARSDELATNTLNEAKFRDFFEMTKTENEGLTKQQAELQPTDPQYKALQKQIDDNNQQLTDQYFKIHPDSKKTPAQILQTTPPPEAAPDPQAKVLQDTLGFTPPPLVPVVSGLLTGQSIKSAAGNPVALPPPQNLRDALNNLDTYQSNVNPSLKLTPADYEKTVGLLKSHFERVPEAQSKQQKSTDEERYQRLHALNPAITKDNMYMFDSNGMAMSGAVVGGMGGPF